MTRRRALAAHRSARGLHLRVLDALMPRRRYSQPERLKRQYSVPQIVAMSATTPG
jgi:hypothetical protein